MSTSLGSSVVRAPWRRSAQARVVGQWYLQELLSENRWIQTFRASPAANTTAGQFVIKRPHSELTSDFDRRFARGLLHREAEVSCELAHRHLTTTLEVLTEGDDEIWLVQPLCAGPILTIAEDQTTAKTLWTIRQAAEALSAMHKSGWLHSNVTPDAIVVGPDGHAALGDLGWARRIGSDECDLNRTSFAGQVRYAAPEVFDDSGWLTAATDVYSLGAVLFELLTGESPHAEYEGPELVAAKRMLPVESVQLEHYEASMLQARMLSRDPLRRPTIREVIEALISLEISAIAS